MKNILIKFKDKFIVVYALRPKLQPQQLLTLLLQLLKVLPSVPIVIGGRGEAFTATNHHYHCHQRDNQKSIYSNPSSP